MTAVSLTSQTARVYDHINAVCNLGDRVPRLTDIMDATGVPPTTVSACLARLARCHLLHRSWTDSPPIIQVYYLTEKNAAYTISELRGQNTRARRALERYDPPARRDDPWEMAREMGY